MRTTIYAAMFLTASSLALSHPLSAQATTSPAQETLVVTRDQAALQLLTQCWQAMGSPALTQPIQADANITPIARGARPAQLTIYIDGPTNMRLDSTRNGATHLFIIADGEGYLDSDPNRNPNSYTAAIHPHPQLLPYLLCSSPLLDPNVTVAYLGIETVEGVSADHVQAYTEVVDSSGNEDKVERRLSQVDIFLNHSTGLPIRAQSYAFELHNATNALLWTTDYNGYAAIDGILMPTTTVEWISAHQVLQYNWTNIVINPSLSSNTFAIGGNQ